MKPQPRPGHRTSRGQQAGTNTGAPCTRVTFWNGVEHVTMCAACGHAHGWVWS